MRKITRYILSLLLSIVAFSAQGAQTTVKAKLDSVQILMGRITLLRLEVVQDANTKGEFEIFRNNRQDGIVGVCGDSVELRTSFDRDTTELGSGRIQINYAIPVQSFDSGFYKLPQLNYIVGKDTARSNSVSLKVLPVPGVTADSEISGYADVMEPADGSIWDKIPDWLYNYWWIVLLAILIIFATIYLVKRYKTEGRILPRKPKESPYATAIRELNKLKSQNLCEQGLERDYYTQLTEILRQYLDARFGINAMEMTTRQINEHLAADARLKDKKEYMRKVLDMADYVKFAAARTLPTDNVEAYDNALRFIEETRPTPEEEAAEKAKEIEDSGYELPEDNRPQKSQKGKSKKSLKKRKGVKHDA